MTQGRITAAELIADFRHMLGTSSTASGPSSPVGKAWGYIPSTSGEIWTQEKQDKATGEAVKKYGSKWIGHHVADCSGAFVWAYRQHGLSIYHGSNRIARRYIVDPSRSFERSSQDDKDALTAFEVLRSAQDALTAFADTGSILLPISEARPGMAAFKVRKPGEQGYALPDEYKPGGAYYNGDLNDYYHIGLVDSDARYVINAQGVSTGVVRSKIEDRWQYAACLKEISYGEEKPVNVLYQAVVTAENGKPVNLRKAASVNAARICTMPVGAEVAVLNETDAEWAEIQYGDKTGYAMRKYLRRIAENTPEERLNQLRELLRQAQALVDEMLGG